MPTSFAKPALHQKQAPKLPELWMLWSETLGWIEAQEFEGDPRLAYLTEADANEGAAYHQQTLDIYCTPVNVLDRR